LRNPDITILYNRFVTDQRGHRIHQIFHPALDEVLDDDLPGADGGQEAMLVYRDLRRGFAALPDDQRAVLLLIGVEDFSYEEAARILRIPVAQSCRGCRAAQNACASI
jgi:RNA polymerase sigma-70 factor (ECF subfamily)